MKYKTIKSGWKPETLKTFFDILYTKSKHYPRQITTISLMGDLARLLKKNIEEKYTLLPKPEKFKYVTKRVKRESVPYSIRCLIPDYEILETVYHTLYKHNDLTNFYSLFDLGVTLLKNECLEDLGELIDNTVDLPKEYIKYIDNKTKGENG